MPDTKITALTAIGANPIIPATFPIPMVDLTDTSMAASGTTKKVTVNQILGSGGTATLASATITGDLTVDTSTLKVDSTNDRVGFGTATPLNRGQIQGAGQATVTPTVTGDQSALSLIDSQTVANNGGMLVLGSICSNGNFGQVGIKSLLTNGLQNGTSALAFFTRAAVADTTLSERYRIAQDGVATWSNVGGVAGTAMTLNSTGLGIGASPSYKLHIGDSQASQTTIYVDNQANDPAASSALTLSAYGGNWNLSVPRSATFVNPLIFKFGSTEMMRIDASGNLLVGTTSAGGNRLNVQTASGDCTTLIKSQAANVNSAIDYVSSYGNHTIRKSGTAVWDFGVINDSSATPAFKISNASAVGVQLVSGATAWTTLSDETVKDIIEPIGNAVAKVGSLRSVIGKFKTDSEGTRRSFLIAQDVKSVLPEAVDVVGENNELGLRYTEVIPLLVAAIKELTARVEALEA
jgi:hypothetical protein